MKLIKELKQACATYGATAPYTFTLLDALAAKWMTPYDWRTVAKACLSGGQYLLWRMKYEDLAKKQANANRKHGPKHITQEMLSGADDYESARDQKNLDKRTLGTGNCLCSWGLVLTPTGKGISVISVQY